MRPSRTVPDARRTSDAECRRIGRGTILKERKFGLTSPEANHGENVKEHWVAPSTPSRATPGCTGAIPPPILGSAAVVGGRGVSRGQDRLGPPQRRAVPLGGMCCDARALGVVARVSDPAVVERHTQGARNDRCRRGVCRGPRRGRRSPAAAKEAEDEAVLSDPNDAPASSGSDGADPTAYARLARRCRAKPVRMKPTPIAAAMSATPNETTEVKSEARRKDAVMTVWRFGSARSSSA